MMSLNNVEKTLSRVGIALRDDANSFRPLEDVIADVADVWGTLDEVTKSQISNAIAGQRQAQIFAVLMQNFGDVEKYVTAETNSLGLATDRYAIYLDGVEAAQNRVTASWEKLVQEAVESGTISGFYDFLSVVLDIISAMGGLKTIIILATVAMVTLNSATIMNGIISLSATIASAGRGLIAFISLLNSATTAQELFNLAMASNPAGLIAILLSGLIIGIMTLSNVMNDSAEVLLDINSKLSEMNSNLDKLKSSKESLKELTQEFENLRNNTERTDQENEKFLDIQNKIKDILPSTAGEFDNLGNFIIDTKVATEDLTAALDDNIESQERLIQLTEKEKINPMVEAAMEQANILAESIETYDYYDKKLTEGALLRNQYLQDASDNIEKNRILMEQTISDMTSFYDSLDESGKAELILTLKQQGETGQTIADAILKSVQEALDGKDLTPPETPTVDVEVKPDVDTIEKEMEKLVKNVVSMLKQIKEQEKDNLQQQLRDFKEIIDQRKQEFKDQLDRQKEAYDDEKERLSRQREDEKRLYDERKTSLDRQREDERRIYDERKEALDRQREDERRIYDEKKQAIEDELDAYEEIIDAQIRLLDKEKEKDDYNDKREEQQKDLAKLENEILVLSLDNSEEAIAKRLMLEEEAAKLRGDISETEEDREYDLRKDALEEERRMAEERTALKLKEMEEAQKAADLEYELHLREMEDEKEASDQEYELLLRKMEDEQKASDQAYELRLREMEDEQKNAERRYEIKIRELEDSYDAKEKSLQDQINLIDEYLSKEGALNQEAMDLILDKNSKVYEDLMAWNKEYGTGIDADIISMWELATQAVNDYSESIEMIPDVPEYIDDHPKSPDERDEDNNPPPTWPPTHHAGVNSGFVGNKMTLKSNEEFSRLMKGELVLNPRDMDNFMKNVLPSAVDSGNINNNTMGGITIEKLLDITITGNGTLDKSVLPDINKIADRTIGELNKVMKSRGFNRRADLFSN